MYDVLPSVRSRLRVFFFDLLDRIKQHDNTCPDAFGFPAHLKSQCVIFTI